MPGESRTDKRENAGRYKVPVPEAMRYRAVIFDLDGTLLDTIEDIAAVLNLVLRHRGFPSLPIEACKRMVGEGMEVLVRRAVPGVFLSTEDVAGITEDYRREYETAWRRHSRPYPGIINLLEGLKSRGAKTAVLSNKSHPFTLTMTKELLPFSFNGIWGARTGFPLKPDPAAALLIAEEMGLPPGVFVFVGDTNVDMETARAAGMFPAGALWGFRDASELETSGAAVLLEKPGDLFELFDG